jgi:serine/threonine protein kinase
MKSKWNFRLFETFEDAKYIYLILELCTGGELFDRIVNEGSLDESKGAHLVRQIVMALYYLHSHCIMHRDLVYMQCIYNSPYYLPVYPVYISVCTVKME